MRRARAARSSAPTAPFVTQLAVLFVAQGIYTTTFQLHSHTSQSPSLDGVGMMRAPLLILLLATASSSHGTANALPSYLRPHAPPPSPPHPSLASMLLTASAAPASALGLNAKDFGAVGNGQTDDTGALQRAIDASQMAGRALLIPAGVYLVPVATSAECCQSATCRVSLG